MSDFPKPKIAPERWQVIELESPFLAGIGYKLTREEAARVGVPFVMSLVKPMSLLAVDREGTAAVDGKETAEFIVAACSRFSALQSLADDFAKWDARYPKTRPLPDREFKECEKELSALVERLLAIAKP
jgi:hypothetical protein